jgi:hypothetical protein
VFSFSIYYYDKVESVFLKMIFMKKINFKISLLLLILIFISNTAYSDEDDYYLGFYLTYTISEIQLGIKKWKEEFDRNDPLDDVCDGGTCTITHPPEGQKFGLAQENKGYGEFSGKLTLTSPDTFWGNSNFGYSFYTIYESISSDVQTPGDGGEPVDLGTYVDATMISFAPALNYIIGRRDDYNNTYLRFSVGAGISYGQVDAKLVSKYSYPEDNTKSGGYKKNIRNWTVLEYEEVHFSGFGQTAMFLFEGRYLTFKTAFATVETPEYEATFITRQYSLGFQIAF